MVALEPLLAVVLPVGLVVLAGNIWARLRPGPFSTLNEVALYVFVPALVYDTVSRSALSWSETFAVGGCAFAVSIGCAALAFLWLRARGDYRPGLILACAVPNNGNLGMSLCLFAFGETGLTLATLYYMGSTVLCFTIGIQLMASRQQGMREIFRTPLPYALVLGALVRTLNLDTPIALSRAAALLGQAAVPCMLLSLGHRLATIPLGRQAAHGHLLIAAQAAALRIGVGLGIALVYVWLVPMSDLTRKVIIVQASMPTAVITTVLTERYARDPGLVATTVALSTAVSLFTLPLLLSML